MASAWRTARLAALLALLLPACASVEPPPGGATAERSATPPLAATSAQATASPAPTALPLAAPAAALAPTVAAAGAEAGADAAVEAPPLDPKNKQAPIDDADLQERARGLFDAIVKNDPALGEAFWFPKAPFIPLKDVKGPDKYWDNLHRTFESDVRALHRKRKSWDGATFERFDRGSTPKWVKPGDEVNKIGYHRSFHGSLRYRQGGETHTIDVHTVITWQGRWFITHLSKFKK